MSDVYYIIGGVAYGIFILQFIISWVAGELDVDVDFDGDADFDIGDVVSFKGLAEASAEMYEHIHLGQVTVYGNENTAGSFMAKTAENLNPAFELLKSIPFKKTFKEMFVEDKKDNPTEDNFEAVK
jgi:hypothetical protein